MSKNNMFWVSLIDYDSFRGIEVHNDLKKFIDKIETITEDVIDEIFEDYETYRDCEVEYASQARHGSVGTETIRTLKELQDYFSYLDEFDEVFYEKKNIICELEDINGYEILDFLNKKIKDDDIELYAQTPFEFTYQELKKGEYFLYFSAYYNNWGEYQEITDNFLLITKKSIEISFNEPLDGNEDEDIIEDLLKEWLSTHTFNNNVEEESMKIIKEVYDELPEISFGDVVGIDELIEKLKKAKTFFK